MNHKIKYFLRKVIPEQNWQILVKIWRILLKVVVKLKFEIFIFFQNKNRKSLLTLKIRKKYESRRFDNIDNFLLNNPGKLKLIYKIQCDLNYCTPKFDNFNYADSDMKEITGVANYAVIFMDVGVIGGSNLILPNDKNVLYDVKYFDQREKYRYSDEAIKYYNNESCVIYKSSVINEFEEAIFMSGNYSWNYYHLVYEILAKFEQIDSLKLDIRIPLLIDKVCVEIPQFRELFTIFNVAGRALILLEKGKRYRVKKLYYFSCPNVVPPDFWDIKGIKPEDVLFNLKTLLYLRSNLLPNKAKGEFPKRIFISRSHASNRRQFNEEEVFVVLEKFGFNKIYPESYSVANQIALFNNAEFIAGGSGAAFTNILFCKQSCKAIIFAKGKLPFSIFSTIARFVGMELLYFTEDSARIDYMKSIHESFHISTERLNSVLNEMNILRKD